MFLNSDHQGSLPLHCSEYVIYVRKVSAKKFCRNEEEVAKQERQNLNDSENDSLNPPNKLLAILSDKKHTNAPVNFIYGNQ